jgi:lipopolysaccharide export system protein LptA
LRYLWRALALLAFGAIGWGAWYLGTHPTWGKEPAPSTQTGMLVHAGSLTVTGWQRVGDRREKVWQVTAHDVGQSAEAGSQWFREISDGVLFRDDQPVARFRAGRGQGNQGANTLSIQDGAWMRLEGDGTTLTTEEVHWRGADRMLWLPRPIRIVRGDLQIQAQRAGLSLQLGHLSADEVAGSDRQLRFHARHSILHLKERQLDLFPVELQMAAGRVHARRVVYRSENGSLTAQEVQMKLSISPAARAAAATGLTLALLNAAAAAPAAPKKTRTLLINGDTLSDDAKRMVVAKAVITDADSSGKTKFSADQVVIEKDAQGHAERMIATGHPRAVDERSEVTGERMTLYPKERRVVVEGTVRVVVKPKPGDEPQEEGGDLRSRVKDGVMTCDRVEYDYRNKNIGAQGNLKLTSRGRSVVGERLFYTDRTEEVEFFNKVDARDEKSQTLHTENGLKLALNKSGFSHIPGPFTATIVVDDEEEPGKADASKKNEPAGKAPASPEKTASSGKK